MEYSNTIIAKCNALDFFSAKDLIETVKASCCKNGMTKDRKYHGSKQEKLNCKGCNNFNCNIFKNSTNHWMITSAKLEHYSTFTNEEGVAMNIPCRNNERMSSEPIDVVESEVKCTSAEIRNNTTVNALRAATGRSGRNLTIKQLQSVTRSLGMNPTKDVLKKSLNRKLNCDDDELSQEWAIEAYIEALKEDNPNIHAKVEKSPDGYFKNVQIVAGGAKELFAKSQQIAAVDGAHMKKQSTYVLEDDGTGMYTILYI